MKRQVISHYNQSKQVLNDFFNNSDDDEEGEEEDKNIFSINDQMNAEDVEQYSKVDNNPQNHQNLSSGAQNSNYNFIHKSLNNQSAFQANPSNQQEFSLSNNQQLSKVQLGLLNNQDIMLHSCNNSVVFQQNNAEEQQSVRPISVNIDQHQEQLHYQSQCKLNNPPTLNDYKSVHQDNINIEENLDSETARRKKKKDLMQKNMDDSDSCYYQEVQQNKNLSSNNLQYNQGGNSSKQQIIDGIMFQQNQKAYKPNEEVKSSTSYYNTEELKGQLESIRKNVQIGEQVQGIHKIRPQKLQTILTNNRSITSPAKCTSYVFSNLHKSIMKREVSINFVVLVIYGIYLILKSNFIDQKDDQSELGLYLISSFIILIGLFGLMLIFLGLKNSVQMRSSSNSMNTKIIFSSRDNKGDITENVYQNNNAENLNNQADIKNNQTQQNTKQQNQQTQISFSPLKTNKGLLKLNQTQIINQYNLQKNQDKQANLQAVNQGKQGKNSNSYLPPSSDSSPGQNSDNLQDERCYMNGIIWLFIFSFVILVESIKQLRDLNQMIFVFFIYNQLIIIYKLSVTRFSQKLTILISFVLFSFAIIRLNLYTYLGDINQNYSSNSKSSKNIIQSVLFDCVFAISLLYQIYNMRLLAISPFLFHPLGYSTLSQEKILQNVGITSYCNLGYAEDALENESKTSKFLSKLISKRTKNKNLKINKQKQKPLIYNNGEEATLLNDNNPISPELERLKSNNIKKMYQDILNLIPEGVALINSSNQLVYANKTLSKILQCSKNQIVNILLNLATKSKDSDATSQKIAMNTNNMSASQFSKILSLNQAITQPRQTSQSVFKSYNSLINNNNNNNIAMSSNQSQYNQSIQNNSNAQQQNPLDINNINPNKLNNQNHGNGQINPNPQQSFPNRKTSSETFDVKRKSSTTKPSIFNRNHKNSFSKDESPAVINLNSNSGVNNNFIYSQMGTSNTKNLSTNGATPMNLNFNTYQGGSDMRKQSMHQMNNFRQSPFEQTMPNMPMNSPIDDFFENNRITHHIQHSANGQHHHTKNYLQNNEYSDAVSLTNYIQQCPLATCQPNCVHSQALFRENGADSLGMNNLINANGNNQDLGGENLVRQQRSKKFKKSEIIRKDINVRDILSSIFENLKITQQDQDTKTAKTFQLKKRNSDITSQQTYMAPQQSRKASPSRQGSFVSQMKNQQQYIGYFQYIDDMIKVEVEYKNSTLVLSMVMCEIVTNGFVEQLALVLVDPLWQEMYEKKLEDMSKYRMKMFASLSHELRTPLNCSISMLQQVKNIMKEDMQADQKQPENILSIKDKIRNKLQAQNKSQSQSNQLVSQNQKAEEGQVSLKLLEKMSDYIQTYIDPALNSNKLLLNLINDILDFVQIDSGKFKFSFIKFDLEELLSSCVSLVGIQGKQNESNVELVLKYDEKCPKIINSDPNRIRQVVLNFLSNAMKFTSQGQIIVSATLINYKDSTNQISSQSQSDFLAEEDLKNNQNNIVEISVEDQGIGISPEDIQKIFTIFNKIDLGENQSLNSQGCGLGLTISNSIAKGLGPINKGGIRVQSEIGHGSVFSILVEDREEDLQEHKIYNKEESRKKMETINSLVDSPVSQQTKMRQLSSFGQVDQYIKQTSQFGRNHSMKVEDSPQVRTIRINSNFTNKSNKTNKTSKTSKTVKTNNQKNLVGSGVQYEDSCCICDSEINRNSIQNLTPIATFKVRENELPEFNDLSSSSSNKSDIVNQDILNVSQKSSISYINNQRPLYKSTTIHTKTTYKTKTLKTIKSEQKEMSGDAYISYNSIHSQAHIKKRNSNSPTTSLIKTPSSQENALQMHLSPIDMSSSGNNNSSKLIASKKRKFLAQSGIKQSQSSSTSIQQHKKTAATSSSALKNIATTATTVAIPPSQQESNFEIYERQSQEISIINDLNFNISKKKSEEDERFDGQQQVLENSSDYNIQKNQNQQNQVLNKENSNLNNTSIEDKTNNLKAQKVCDCAQLLVVDDNLFNMHAITMQLKTYGFKIDQAQNGQKAVELVEKRYYENTCCKSYKLIFMDIEMPIKNGYEATQDIRNFFNGNSYISKQPIIVACTAYVSDEDKSKALANGMDDFIKKPVFQEALDLLLNQWYNVIFDENDESEEEEDYDDDDVQNSAHEGQQKDSIKIRNN
ncbi:ATPase, histidine kinase-, DNA gyrase B (macronuclear) [Tetrahymena thermophila SB210]|uniref:histidine kinase n=1 Tax=Tetrahymena thermophila (strain SB210) TaxID=312017 RepID=Q22P25_TETTS|nr:ATPase, histidine kinase-, DNA gyrase B [Tetrahymena thermophila SB210]EAR86986.2 ATPase, histidine kinase-, DNA gyrase B [Tetrahymena thermophila SB210]|eukprot:XP_001007231.2 ATPase, histidine kinase-, DNA gyrase B [Tetrahymena thermophila SB210]